jgi:Fic family protein
LQATLQSVWTFEIIEVISFKAPACFESRLSKVARVKKSDFKAQHTGRLVTTPQRFLAFVPAPLPPDFDYDPALVRLLSRADAGLSELSGIGRLLPNPHLLIAPWVRREAVLSSRIEGTRTTLSELLIDELGDTAGRKTADPDMQEVRNYVEALEYGRERLAALPLSLRLVRELHARLMKDVRGGHATPGEFRTSQNWIGPEGSTPETAAYVPPPVSEMTACLDSWEKFLHERDAFPDLIQCALMHEQFEAIHPFLDGNGRVGRLLITLFLIERGRLSQPLLYLSDYIDTNRQDYYGLLQRVRTHGEWGAWLRFFINGVLEISKEASSRIATLLELHRRYTALVREAGRLATTPLIDQLFQNPYVTVAAAQAAMKVSNPTARSAINFLHDKGMLREITGREWGRMYVADEILEAIGSGESGRE